MKNNIIDKYIKEIHRTERTNNQKLVEWINEIANRNNLPIGEAEQETTGKDRKQPDIIIRKTKGSNKILCVIELKNPAFIDLFNEEELYEPARKKATMRKAPYFGTSNFRELIIFNTARANQLEPLEKQIVQRYTLSDIKQPDEIEDKIIKSAIQRNLERFLFDLYEISTGQKAEPKHPIDEILVYRLQTTIRTLTEYYKYIIEEMAINDKTFLKNLGKWFLEQGWSFSKQRDDYEKAARQTAYLLVNKILFYDVIQPIRRLDPLQIPKDLTKGAVLQKILQGFFDEILKLDYETIYTTDFIDQIAFPDETVVVTEVKELIDVLSFYDFTKIGYDVLGRIFERLIPDNERHLLGQYFTSSDIVDIILCFCMKHENDKILDPSCGAGTFLVRAYQHKKLLNQRLTHENILENVWGIDISKFPAHLTTINLAINDLKSDENYPRILRQDFFDLMPDSLIYGIPKNAKEVKLKGLSKLEKTIENPKYYDAIVGNPPYTRHLEIEDIQNQAGNYKSQIRQKALLEINGKKFADVSKRAGIYAYFFIHSTKFLKEGGRFGFIVANSWLDADFGKGLQDHFLNHYKILAIIESQVERWFSDAEVNTCIIILEKASGRKQLKDRNDNTVRFVYLKKPLRHFMPLAESMWEKEVNRRQAAVNLVKTILAHSDYYENDELRIFAISQTKLHKEGFDQVENKYVGSKWGKYVRAPEIFFKISQKTENKFIPIIQLGEVNEGKPTGAENFFFVKKDFASKYGIEKTYLKKAILKPRTKNLFELKSSDIEHYFFSVTERPIDLKGTGAFKYIKHGEYKKYHTRSTFTHKEYWYQFKTRRPSELLLSRGIGSRHYCVLNTAKAISSGSFTEIRLNNSQHKYAIWAFFNSSLGWLFLELSGRPGMGGGLLKIDPTDVRKLSVIDPNLVDVHKIKEIKNNLNRKVGTVEEESMAKDRIDLDKYILGDILGISSIDQQEIRKAVVELVNNRHLKAESVKGSKRSKSGIDLDLLTNEVLKQAPINSFIKYIKDKIASNNYKFKKLPVLKGTTKIENTLLGWQLKSGKNSIDCHNEIEARYLSIFLEMGWSEAPVPTDINSLDLMITSLEKQFKKIKSVFNEHSSTILQSTVRERFRRIFWVKVKNEIEDVLKIK